MSWENDVNGPQPKTGVDTGGTFTDFVRLEQGRLRIHKQSSTPDDPSRAVLAGINDLQVPRESAIVHGSTVATNALLERRGAVTALITTAGFADVLAIGRQNRPDLYALVPQKPPPLVPRRWRYEVEERVTAAGDVLQPLDPGGLVPIFDQMVSSGVESVAVCLLFSFLRPEHEQQIKERLLRMARDDQRSLALHISLSSEILPEYREFERMAATVVNAYVAPLMNRYLRRLAAGVAPRSLSIMQSNGGVISAERAGAHAARTVLSGPAGGVVGAHFVAKQAGFSDIITFDMGGTSTDVALCPGRLPTTTEGAIAGLPLRLPTMDIHTVGAGGGSLAYVDPGGALHVGPESAGAVPGPACYGLEIGATDAGALPYFDRYPLPITVTDANLVLGRLDAGHFLGGEIPLHEKRAVSALEQLAPQLDAAGPQAAAWDAIQVANATMERAMRRISVERGHDPRRFTLVAFGGAGPLHACDLAGALGIPRVLIPPVPGVLSALGMLVAVPTRDYSQTVMTQIGEDNGASGEWVQRNFKPLEEQALADMAAEGHRAGDVTLRRLLDVRYRGQSHELTIPVDLDAPAIGARFHEAHEKRYGYRRPQEPVEIVNVRLQAMAPVTPPELPRRPAGDPDAGDAHIGQKPVWFDRAPQTTDLYLRERLRPGHTFDGPAVIFQYDTTTVIPPGWQAHVDPLSNLILTRSPS